MVFAEKFMKGLVVAYSRSEYTAILGQLVNPLERKILENLAQHDTWLETPKIRSIVKDTQETIYARLRSLHKSGLIEKKRNRPTQEQRQGVLAWKITEATRTEILAVQAMKSESRAA